MSANPFTHEARVDPPITPTAAAEDSQKFDPRQAQLAVPQLPYRVDGNRIPQFDLL